MAGQRLLPEERLRNSLDFQRCYRRGRRIQAGCLTLHFVGNGEQGPRLGVTASRKVGTAVVRNRLKRRAREIYRQWPLRQQLPRIDLVVHFQPRAALANFAEIEQQLTTALARLVDR